MEQNKPRPISLYNTLTRRVEPFEPMHSPKVNMFVCGPTVYGPAHLGHAKTTVQFDFIARFLRFAGYKVRYLQNITDIDDKIIAKSREEGVSWDTLSRRYEEQYLEDMGALHCTAVNEYPRATAHITQIISQVKRLLDKGCAYKISDGIYFDLSTFPEYGKLSGRREVKEDDSVSRIDESAEKKNWNDFCLWKFRKEGEPYWEADIGEGRPGWHIEDTAITESSFGPQYDLHGGAIDLIFPHHEAEICQMESVSGLQPFVRYWLHTGFLNIGGAKMSKSLGNFQTVREALQTYDYRVLRFFFLSAHYRTTINLSLEVIEQNKHALERINEFLFRVDPGHDDVQYQDEIAKLQEQVMIALSNDFNSPQALAEIYQFIRAHNNDTAKLGKRCVEYFRSLNSIFDFLSLEKRQGADESIQKLIDEREEARKRRDFARSDAIRDQLLEQGIQIYDTKEGVKWRLVK